MAGSYKHCADSNGNYAGIDLIENLGDAEEAIEELFFIMNYLARKLRDDAGNIPTIEPPATKEIIQEAVDAYYRCARGEESWPEYMGVKRDSYEPVYTENDDDN